MNLWTELTCTVRNVPKHSAHSFVLMSNLHHDVKVQHQRFLCGKTSSVDNHMLSQDMWHRPRLCFDSAQPLDLLSSLFLCWHPTFTMMSRSSARFHLHTKTSSHDNHMLSHPQSCLSHFCANFLFGMWNFEVESRSFYFYLVNRLRIPVFSRAVNIATCERSRLFHHR